MNNRQHSIHISRYTDETADNACYLLYFIQSGPARLCFSERSLCLQAGDCCLLQPGAAHDLSAYVPGQVLLLTFPREVFQYTFLPFLTDSPLLCRFFSDSFRCGQSVPYLHFEKRQEDITPYFLRLEQEYRQQAPCYESVLICGLMGTIIQLTRTYWTHTTVLNASSNDLFNRVITYLLKNYPTATLDSTARHFNYHPNTISALIRRETGHTFSNLLRDIRLKQAAFYLSQTSLPVEEIALRCGYEHLGHFYRIFKDMYGMTPKIYAQEHHADAK